MQVILETRRFLKIISTFFDTLIQFLRQESKNSEPKIGALMFGIIPNLYIPHYHALQCLYASLTLLLPETA